jgi:hypothetical protein
MPPLSVVLSAASASAEDVEPPLEEAVGPPSGEAEEGSAASPSEPGTELAPEAGALDPPASPEPPEEPDPGLTPPSAG